MHKFLYNLTRHYWSGAPLSRWLLILLLVGAGVTGAGWVSGGWIGTAAWLLVFLALIAAITYWRRRDFVVFKELTPPQFTPKRLKPVDKIPIFATGQFSVEGKDQRFTWLQGFFRTFATREHAVICLVPGRRFLLLGEWPSQEVGMWYQFFNPDDILQVRWGEVRFGSASMTGLAVAYQVHTPKRGRFRPARTTQETIFLACENHEDAEKIMANLLYEKNKQSADTIKQTPDISRLNGLVRSKQTNE